MLKVTLKFPIIAMTSDRFFFNSPFLDTFFFILSHDIYWENICEVNID